MSEPVLILGASGSGKSTAIRTLPPLETYLIKCWNKRLPFKGALKNYQEQTTSNPTGNTKNTDDYEKISKILTHIDKVLTNIHYLVIDDSQFLMANQFMKGHSAPKQGSSSFDLFNSIADNFWKLIFDCGMLRNDLFIFFLHHTEENECGTIRPKTVGKLVEEKIGISSMFTYTLLAKNNSGEYNFLTQNDGTHPAKTPAGMFESNKINNDLLFVAQSIKNFYEGEQNGV